MDTCVLLWAAGGAGDKLSAKVRERLQTEPESWGVSSISAFEIGVKAGRGALRLAMPADQWFVDAVAELGANELPVTGIIAARSTLLPPLHRDPADRILVATAVEHALTLVTPDDLIRQYPEVPTLW